MSIPGLVHIENKLWCISATTGDPTYDFTFEQQFACRHPYRLDQPITAISRLGATSDYPSRFQDLCTAGTTLVHTPEQYRLTSELPAWYPLLEDLTPRSAWFDEPPPVSEIENRFDWPVFLKGERQTSRHQRHLSIIEHAEQYASVTAAWRRDPILAWQRVVCREFVPLRRVDAVENTYMMPRSFEFRSFWWHGHCVGYGRYWTAETYQATHVERDAMLAVAGEAASRLGVAFLVVDVAQTVEGQWIVIEVNDGQDAGYAGVPRRAMWQRIIDLIGTTDQLRPA